MRRMIFSEEEYNEIHRFAEERRLNPKEAVLAFVRFGNKASDKGWTTRNVSEPENPSATNSLLTDK